MSCGIYRTFLDTNIVWCIDWLGPYIFDGDDEVLSSPKFQHANRRQQREWLALAEIVRWAQRVNPVFIVGETVVAELRPDRQPLGWELYQWTTQSDYYAKQVPATDADYGLLAALPNHDLTSFLPDSNDRRLLAEAVFYVCDSFLTMDQRTIWRHRRRIREGLGISVLRPSQMFSAIFLKLPVPGSGPNDLMWISCH